MIEAKATKDNKCAKCHRDIRQGWKIYFDEDTKQVYCKPCGTILSKSVPASGSNELVNLKELENRVDIIMTMTNATWEEVKAVNETLSVILNRLPTIPVKKGK